MAELIAPGTTVVNSADITVTAGAPVALFIKPDPAVTPAGNLGQDYWLQHKTSAGAYVTVAILNASNILALGNIVGAGTYRVQRQASTVSTGMDSQ